MITLHYSSSALYCFFFRDHVTSIIHPTPRSTLAQFNSAQLWLQSSMAKYRELDRGSRWLANTKQQSEWDGERTEYNICESCKLNKKEFAKRSPCCFFMATTKQILSWWLCSKYRVLLLVFRRIRMRKKIYYRRSLWAESFRKIRIGACDCEGSCLGVVSGTKTTHWRQPFIVFLDFLVAGPGSYQQRSFPADVVVARKSLELIFALEKGASENGNWDSQTANGDTWRAFFAPPHHLQWAD